MRWADRVSKAHLGVSEIGPENAARTRFGDAVCDVKEALVPLTDDSLTVATTSLAIDWSRC